jgi:hypothetical protein
MRPDQRSGRARDPGFAAPFGQPLRMLLAARKPPRQHEARHRRRERGEAAIGAQGPRQPFSHEHLFARYPRMRKRQPARPDFFEVAAARTAA